MCVCVYIYIYICMMYTCITMYIQRDIHTDAVMLMHACLMYILHIHIYIYIYMHIYIYTHTYMYTSYTLAHILLKCMCAVHVHGLVRYTCHRNAKKYRFV